MNSNTSDQNQLGNRRAMHAATPTVFLATVLALFFCRGAFGANDATFVAGGREGGWKSVLKPSLIGIPVGERDLHRLSELPNVDVLLVDPEMLSERDVPKWRECVKQVHARGQLFCSHLRPATHFGKTMDYLMNEPGMQAAVCLDLEMKPIPIGWFRGHLYKGRWPSFYCTNNPRFVEYIRQQVYLFCEIGSDAIMVDDSGGTFFAAHRGGCFCPYCMSGFRDYLKDKYTPEQLKGMRVDDADTFDYRQLVLKHVEDTKTYIPMAKKREIPLSADFFDFLVRSDVALFESLKTMSCKLAGRYVPMGWDNVDFAGSRAPYYPFLDASISEINHQHFSVGDKAIANRLSPAIVMLNKAADAFNMWYNPTPAPNSWQAIRDEKVTGLLKQWIAVTFANGGAMRYPRGAWIISDTNPWWKPPQEEFEPLFDFVRRHRELFDAAEPIEQVGVVFTQDYKPLKRVVGGLVEGNVPFGFAPAGDDLLRSRLKGGEADRYEMMLIPEPIRLTDGQDKIVARWKTEGKAIAIGPDDDVMAKLAGHLKGGPLVALDGRREVWLFPRKIPGKDGSSIACHLVAANFDPVSNKSAPQLNVAVRLSNKLFGVSKPKRASYYSIGQPPRELPVEASDGAVRVVVPELDLWGVLKLSAGSEL